MPSARRPTRLKTCSSPISSSRASCSVRCAAASRRSPRTGTSASSRLPRNRTCCLSNKEPFRIPVRVYYQDTDAGGVVFHAQYLSFMERARTELLNESGIDLARIADEKRVLFLVYELKARYHQPARLNDMLSVSAEVATMGRASLLFRQRVERAGALLVEADVTLALVDRDRMKPVRIPEELAKALGAAQEPK